ncbi:caffeoylshikimate esterase-like [Pistacia vera]|uniref:caffeoylshikimate esterase-like n=1 Tax=Pistacia vera TaxID=55513 RepID=UPI0012639865|nr:caffeoylshikimate esterase-like [Pistacia vera]XP_031260443.1 caffeoylshikimate esterase-like [Pistacia vera]
MSYSHPIHQANENSPYGDLTREQFYKKHQILHQQTFMLNRKNMKIFTQSWRPDSSTHLKGLVAMVHGYASDSGWLFELTAVAIAKAGFLVCALDLQGHGCSDGAPGHIPKIQYIVRDCIAFFDSMKAKNPKLPSFLYGESLGGAISVLICLEQKYEWDGLILSGSMCGISPKFKPIWPLEKLLPLAALFAPSWKTVASKPVASKLYKEEWKRRLVARNPNRRTSGKPPAATAMEFLRVCEYIKMHCHELEVPFIMLHGEDDTVCDYESARFVYKSAVSEDKTLKIFSGMWHILVGETEENVEIVFGNVLSWMEERAAKAKARMK